MNIRVEIEKYADKNDKPILLWLFDRYHMESQWSFVATCSFQSYGTFSYQTHRIWAPTSEGRILYSHGNQKEQEEVTVLPKRKS